MTVKELKEKLESFNPDMKVCVHGEDGYGDDFIYIDGPITYVEEYHNKITDTTVLYIGYK